jgi:mRNA-degrading endonuclease RelE of RelBE toxin-antitoxin system
MRHEIVLGPDAARAYKALDDRFRAEVRDAIEIHLRYQPEKVSKSRIKRLRGLTRPQYRLRVGEVRVYYDVLDDVVQILAVVDKSKASDWLKEKGEKS